MSLWGELGYKPMKGQSGKQRAARTLTEILWWMPIAAAMMNTATIFEKRTFQK